MSSKIPVSERGVFTERRKNGVADARLQTLLEATGRLSQSIDYEQTLNNVVGFVAERFASYSLLDIVAEDGRIERVAVAHSSADRQPIVERIRAFNPPAELTATHPVARAIARGEATLETIDRAWIARAAISPDHAATMEALEMRCLLVVPVRSGRRILGALTCALDARAMRETFDSADIAFAEELGRRAGLAIENAKLYEHERRIALVLQDASLPRRLPISAEMKLDAFYRPARSEAAIGGDWYDAFVLDDGRIVLTVGDVVGKGLAAAVTMGHLRQTMRTAALMAPRADALLAIADRSLKMNDEELYATAIAVIYDPRARTFEIASAGHPQPMLRDPDGPVRCLPVSGAMLGIGTQPDRPVLRIDAKAGATLVLYTDGLIELTKNVDDGTRDLGVRLRETAVCAKDHPARALVDEVIGRAIPSDDIAVLVAIVT